MAFKKGDKNINRKGRPAGKPNGTTEAIRAIISDIITENLPRIRQAVKDMTDKECIIYIEKLLKYCLPPAQDELMKLSDSDLDRLIQRLKNKEF